MRVAVTGADGFTGRYLVPLLRGQGHQVVALTADITDPSALDGAVAAAAPQATIHLAGSAFVHSGGMAGFYGVNQIGTFNLLDALSRYAPGGRVLLASSGQVYGAAGSGLLDEGAALAPGNHYAVSKLAMEVGARLWADRLDLLVVRPFNYTGVGQEERYVLPKIVAHFRRREPLIELGNTDVRRDLGDVRATVAAYAGLLGPGVAPGVYNVSTGRMHAIREVIDRLTAMTGHAIEVSRNPTFVRPGEAAALGGDNRKLAAALPDWSPIPLDDTLAWMLAGPGDDR